MQLTRILIGLTEEIVCHDAGKNYVIGDAEPEDSGPESDHDSENIPSPKIK